MPIRIMASGDVILWKILHEKIDPLRLGNRLAEAVRTARKALEICLRAYPSPHPAIAVALDKLAEMLLLNGETAEAEAHYREELRMVTELDAPRVEEIIRLTTLLGELNTSLQNGEDAEIFYRRAIALIEETHGAESVECALMLNNLALMHQAHEQYEQAEADYLRSLAIYEISLGTDHPETAVLCNNLGMLYVRRGEYDKAYSMHNRALAIRQQALGEDHADTAKSIANLAVIHHSLGELDQAERLYHQALQTFEKTKQTDSEYAVIAQNFADLLRSSGQIRRASAVEKKASRRVSRADRM